MFTAVSSEMWTPRKVNAPQNKRQKNAAVRAPGPAYYKVPEIQGGMQKKSYHLNLKSSWV